MSRFALPSRYRVAVARPGAQFWEMKLSQLLATFGFVSILAVASALFAGESVYPKAVTVTPLMKTRTDSAGQPIAYPTGGPAEVTAVLVEIAPGKQTNWHHHPVPCVAYILEGELEVELPDHTVKHLGAGQAFVEVVGLQHNGRNVGAKPAKLVFFALSTVGQPYAVKAPAAPTPQP